MEDPKEKKMKTLITVNFPSRPQISKGFKPNNVELETNHFQVEVKSID